MSGVSNCVLPWGYHASLNLRETEIAIKQLKDFFEVRLAQALNLTRVSAPLSSDRKQASTIT